MNTFFSNISRILTACSMLCVGMFNPRRQCNFQVQQQHGHAALKLSLHATSTTEPRAQEHPAGHLPAAAPFHAAC